jgi:glyoxylase I family protein
MFKGVEHTALASPDPLKLANWYVENLGFHINFEYLGNYFVKASDGTMLEIVPSEGGPLQPTLKTPGIRHIAIAVTDFDSALAHIRAKNVKLITEPYAAQGNRLVFFEDGDGNFLHLIQRETPLP